MQQEERVNKIWERTKKEGEMTGQTGVCASLFYVPPTSGLSNCKQPRMVDTKYTIYSSYVWFLLQGIGYSFPVSGFELIGGLYEKRRRKKDEVEKDAQANEHITPGPSLRAQGCFLLFIVQAG